jgi:hypothetical protein
MARKISQRSANSVVNALVVRAARTEDAGKELQMSVLRIFAIVIVSSILISDGVLLGDGLTIGGDGAGLDPHGATQCTGDCRSTIDPWG